MRPAILFSHLHVEAASFAFQVVHGDQNVKEKNRQLG
jgi:hypothetical protein